MLIAAKELQDKDNGQGRGRATRRNGEINEATTSGQ
jgi:hypothetical protein